MDEEISVFSNLFMGIASILITCIGAFLLLDAEPSLYGAARSFVENMVLALLLIHLYVNLYASRKGTVNNG